MPKTRQSPATARKNQSSPVTVGTSSFRVLTPLLKRRAEATAEIKSLVGRKSGTRGTGWHKSARRCDRSAAGFGCRKKLKAAGDGTFRAARLKVVAGGGNHQLDQHGGGQSGEAIER